jgi:tetratricopeptide (TPR) repeat protein
MIASRLARMGLVFSTAALLSVPFIPSQVEAQDGSRFRVLVANLTPTDGTRDRFGERTSDRLRDILDLPTHVAMGGRDIDQAARQYDLRLNDLDCVTARQLADLLSVPLVFCGEYETVDGQIRYQGSFFTVPAGEEFRTDPDMLAEGDDRVAAENILTFFEGTVERLNQIAYCGMDFNSANWEGALQYCTRAIELAPESTESRNALARTYMELERYEDALEQFEILLDEQPNSSSALESAGWVAAQLFEAEKAFEYYSRFLEINPDNVQVRARVAYDLAQAGDDEGAMNLLQEGIEQAPDNVDLHEQYGSYAFRAAANRQAFAPQQDGDGPSINPEIAELYRNAVASLERVFEQRREETNPGHVHNSIRARIQLGDLDEAIEFGRRAREHFSQDATVLRLTADAYSRRGDPDRAIELMGEALAIQPDLPDAHARMAQWHLQAGNVDEAIEMVHQANAAGEQTPDRLAAILFGHGWNQGVQAGNVDMGVRLISEVKEIEGISDQERSRANFFHGYALFQRADGVFREDTSLEASRRYLPDLQAARNYLAQGEIYATQSGTDLQQFLTASQQWIEVAEAVIAREGG